jgi:hypothetical protein
MIKIVPLLALAIGIAPAGNTAAPGMDSITISALKEHVRFLASPALQGRKPGQPGYRMASEYAAKCFREAGLVPMYKDDEGRDSFLQPVPLIGFKLGAANRLTLKRNGREEIFPHGGNNYLLASPGDGRADMKAGPPVFVGHGIHDPEHGWDDFAGLNIAGSVVILMDGVPADSDGTRLDPETRRKYSDRTKSPGLKLNAIAARGAAGVVIAPSKGMVQGWQGLTQYQRQIDFTARERYSEDDPPSSLPVLVAHPKLIQFLFSGRDYDPFSRKGAYRTFVLEDVEMKLTIDVSKTPFTAHNVVGMVRGADPALLDRYLTVSAHLDHLGTDGKDMFPGANDDASGSATVLQLARVMSQRPPGRSVIFALFAAEETGRLGSLHFVHHPPVELSRILLNINLEQVGRKNAQLDGFWLLGPESLQAASISTSRNVGVAVAFETAASRMGVFRMSDNYSFHAKGIPALLISCGSFPEYHSPSDKAESIEFEHLRNAGLFAQALIMNLGSR